MTDNELKRTLQDGMRQVAFSDAEKHRLAAQLKQAMRAGKAAPAPAPAPAPALRWQAFAERAAAFWNGTTEISLPAATAALILIGLGMWSSLSPLLLVDQNTAALLIQASTENARAINQGVSLL
jgi:hypothetical protein